MDEFDPWSSNEPLADIGGFTGFVTEGDFDLDEEDLLLYALLVDSIYAAELLWDHPTNHEYGGLYRVYDYQYPLWRTKRTYAGFACSRSIGKTESIKGHAFSHTFKRIGENLLVTAPELIHLLPVTDAIEDRIRDTRLTQEFLDTRGGKTGFTHRPFGVDFLDGTKIVGRIPRLTGPQPLDEPVATPTGWTTMGELQPGDRVFGSDGKAVKVLEVHEKGEREVFALEFSEGSVVRATGDHRFLVRRDRSQKWRQMNVDEVRRDIEKPAGTRKYYFHVPDGVPIHYDKLDSSLPVDPWLLGVLLGDGGLSTHAIYLTNPDEEIVQGVRDALPATCELKKLPREYRYLVIGEGRGRGKENRLNRVLRELELLGNPNAGDGKRAQTKLIPEMFLRASLAERLALLQGLLDTDGTASKEGKVSITLDNFEMVEQIAELARSLGGWASVRLHVLKPYTQMINGESYENKGGEFWMATLDMGDLPPFRLARKLAQCRGRKSPRARAIKVVASEGPMETRCISVAASDHLYLSSFFIPVFNTGVKGQHQPDLRIEEAQDYPEKGWIEVHETVEKDHVDQAGEPDFTYWFYGVHSGARESGFYKRINQGSFELISITRLQTKKWNKAEKDAAIAAYGGTNAPDYRRNVLGEAGAPASPFFVMSRLMASVDQDRESDYNQNNYERQKIHAEEIEDLDMEMADILSLPTDFGPIHAGMDVGLTISPTVISLFSAEKLKGKDRLKLLRVYELWRLRPKQIRAATYALAFHLGGKLKSFGMDVTGLGFPMYQEMEDDEAAPAHLLEVSRGYFFNAAVPVGVQKEFITEDTKGQMRDQFGSAVKEEIDPLSGEKRYITTMPMIEASTRYVRDWIDSGKFLLPFDQDVVGDMQGETHQRVKAVGERRMKKPNAFHILDSFRAAAMAERAEYIEGELEGEEAPDVLDLVG